LRPTFGVGGAVTQLKWTVIHRAVRPAAEGVVFVLRRGGAVVVGQEIARLVVAEDDRLFRIRGPTARIIFYANQLVSKIILIYSPLSLGLDLLHQIARLVVGVTRGLAHGSGLLHQLIPQVILEAGALALGIGQADQVASKSVLISFIIFFLYFFSHIQPTGNAIIAAYNPYFTKVSKLGSL